MGTLPQKKKQKTNNPLEQLFIKLKKKNTHSNTCIHHSPPFVRVRFYTGHYHVHPILSTGSFRFAPSMLTEVSVISNPGFPASAAAGALPVCLFQEACDCCYCLRRFRKNNNNNNKQVNNRVMRQLRDLPFFSSVLNWWIALLVCSSIRARISQVHVKSLIKRQSFHARFCVEKRSEDCIYRYHTNTSCF